MTENRVREIVREELGKDKKEEIIYVPDNIKIVRAGFGDGLGLCFGDGQVLIVNTNGSYGVCQHYYNHYHNREVKCKLVKVDKPEPGNLYFRTDSEVTCFNNHVNYCKKLKDDKHAYIDNNKDTKTGNWIWRYWYQVVEV